MRRRIYFILLMTFIALVTMGQKCSESNTATKEAKEVDRQQAQYSIGQPQPAYDWYFERHLMIKIYNLRNKKVATHAVWRSDYGMIEGDCPSLGFGLPYDVSLTNPLVGQYISSQGGVVAVEQPEPNGIFASKNTSATWVMCVNDVGGIEPVYIESKVSVFPGPVKVNYKTNRVTRSGAATVRISKE